MADVIVVQEGEDEGATIEGQAVSPGDESAETVEAVADASVEIAKIEAERDVELAEIAKDAREAEAEIIAEAIESDKDKELEECRLNIATLQTELATTRERLEVAEAALLSIQPQLTTPEEVLPSLAEVEESVEVTPESQEAPAPEPNPPKRRKVLWI